MRERAREREVGGERASGRAEHTVTSRLRELALIKSWANPGVQLRHCSAVRGECEPCSNQAAACLVTRELREQKGDLRPYLEYRIHEARVAEIA